MRGPGGLELMNIAEISFWKIEENETDDDSDGACPPMVASKDKEVDFVEDVPDPSPNKNDAQEGVKTFGKLNADVIL